MTAAPDLADLASALRAFERDARGLCAAIAPLIRRGNSFNSGYRDDLAPEVAGALHRVVVLLNDCVAIVGSAHFDLTAHLAAH